MSKLIVIDTNVLVSSLISSKEDSPTVQIMIMVFNKEIKPLLSKDIFEEYKEVLYRDKFNFSKEKVDYILCFLLENSLFIEANHYGTTLSDPKDVPFYELALEYQRENVFLITGNSRHFPKEDFIITPREFIELL